MQSEITEHTQSAIRPGEIVDTYYYGETNSEKQAYPCIVNNKFYLQFPNLGAGTSQFVVSPNQGISDIVISATLPGSFDYTGWGFPQGWLAQLINRVSVRYGSSSQYYFTGQQILCQNMFDCENDTKRDALFLLGGKAVANADLTDPENRRGYLYLNLPHNSPRADGKPLPFSSDLLVQPIVITIEMNPIASVATQLVSNPTNAVLPTSFSEAWLQIKQEIMEDSADLLARKVDMNVHAYTLPLKYFAQQEVQVKIPAGQGAPASVQLSGFRSGSVQRIILWLTQNTETGNGQGQNPSAAGNWPVDGLARNLAHWYPIQQIVLTYNGEIFFRSDEQSSAIWNLVNDTKQPGFNTTVVSAVNAGVPSYTNVFSYYVDMPFSQTNVPYDKEVKLVAGKPILNSVVQLTFTVPDNTKDYTLHALYLYNSSLLCSRGSAEYIF